MGFFKRDERIIKPFIQALEDENPEGKEGAARALGEIGDERAVEPLIKALKNENWGVRQFAA